jgi:hypothetical protein
MNRVYTPDLPSSGCRQRVACQMILYFAGGGNLLCFNNLHANILIAGNSAVPDSVPVRLSCWKKGSIQ